MTELVTFVRLYPPFVFIALVDLLAAVAYVGAALLAVRSYPSRIEREALSWIGSTIGLVAVIALFQFSTRYIIGRIVGNPSNVDALIFLIAIMVVLPVIGCLMIGLHSLRSRPLARGHLRATGWAIAATMLGLATSFMGNDVVPRVLGFHEAYNLAQEVGLDPRDMAMFGRFPATYFAAKIVPGVTTEPEARQIMRLAKAHYRCDASLGGSATALGGQTGHIDKYLFLSSDPLFGQQVIMGFDQYDVALGAGTLDSSDYRFKMQSCEKM
ncbi:MAG: hypothetical protein QOF51_1660 [Chloroflexota bacterium]|jgi:hypothetical protein|nr:hypothetical protein [Chloroflexota bacterium]